MSVHIRPFTPEDYPALAAVNNAVFPDYPATVEELMAQDQHRDPKCRFERYLAEKRADACSPQVVGVATLGQSSLSYHPRKFWLDLSVTPERRGQGIGRALYDHLRRRIAADDPISIRACVREDMERSLRFLADRGFTEIMREWESRLPVADFDPSRFAGAEDRVKAQGIEIRSLAELVDTDPDCYRKLYDVVYAAEEDVPRSDPEFSPPEFDRWLKRLQSNPNLLPEGCMIAVYPGLYVGMSQVWKMQGAPDLETGLTGVRREFRRKGIALALKLRVIEYARREGYPVIRTWNASTNEGMLSINIALGFVRQPAWIDFRKQFSEDAKG